VVVVLGRVVVDVGDAHAVFEVRIPTGREVHGECECARRLAPEAGRRWPIVWSMRRPMVRPDRTLPAGRADR
jgi:hypothetical protein